MRGFPSDLREEILFYADEAYRALAAKCYRATIVLAAEALQRANCELILQKVKSGGKTIYKQDGKLVSLEACNVTVSSLLDNFTLNKTISLLEELGLIDEQTVIDMHALRFMRNQIVHKGFPFLTYYDPPLPSTLTGEEFIARITGDPPPQQFMFTFKLNNKEIEYTIDPEKLGVSLEDLSAEQRQAVVSLKLMLQCFQKLVKNFREKSPLTE